MEKKEVEVSLSLSYRNSGFDAEPTSEPTASKLDERTRSQVHAESIPGPSSSSSYPPPKYDENEIVQDPDPGAPIVLDADVNTDPAVLKYNSPLLLFEDIYEICIQYVKSNCCYSSRFAKQMKLTEIKNDCAFHYLLETYGEKRKSQWTSESYKKGDPVDGPSNGTPPDPWDIDVPLPDTLFEDDETWEPIPHTEKVKRCWECSGSGKVSCHNCHGSGTDSCSSCNGSGRNSEDRSCSSCRGRGTKRCSSCSGSGIEKCSECWGTGKIKKYKEIIVTWKNHQSQFVSNIRKLPTEKIIHASGDILFREESIKLSPMLNAPLISVNTASASLLEEHPLPTEVIRKQRHCLRAIPFTVVKYKWKDQEGEFYIYGKEKEVYFEEYPTSYCCICC